jgi:Tfp pilus assembly protein PilF
MMKGEPAKAAIAWTDAFTANPQNARAAAEAGLCFIRAGDRQHAEQYLGLAKRLDANNPTVRALNKALQAPPTPSPAPGA